MGAGVRPLLAAPCPDTNLEPDLRQVIGVARPRAAAAGEPVGVEHPELGRAVLAGEVGGDVAALRLGRLARPGELVGD